MSVKSKQKKLRIPVVYCDDDDAHALFAFCLQCRKGPRWSSNHEKRTDNAIDFRTTHTGCKAHWDKHADMFDIPNTRNLTELVVKEAEKKSDSPATKNTFVSAGSEMSQSLRSSLKRWNYIRDNGDASGYESDEEVYDEDSVIDYLQKDSGEADKTIEDLKAENERLKTLLAEARGIVLDLPIQHTPEGRELLNHLPLLW